MVHVDLAAIRGGYLRIRACLFPGPLPSPYYSPAKGKRRVRQVELRNVESKHLPVLEHLHESYSIPSSKFATICCCFCCYCSSIVAQTPGHSRKQLLRCPMVSSKWKMRPSSITNFHLMKNLPKCATNPARNSPTCLPLCGDAKP